MVLIRCTYDTCIGFALYVPAHAHIFSNATIYPWLPRAQLARLGTMLVFMFLCLAKRH
jgi:hypothetical protein